MIQDPVHQDSDGLWYFWEENWALRHGPFDTEDQARLALTKYCREQLGEPDVRKTHSFKELENLNQSNCQCNN